MAGGNSRKKARHAPEATVEPPAAVDEPPLAVPMTEEEKAEAARMAAIAARAEAKAGQKRMADGLNAGENSEKDNTAGNAAAATAAEQNGASENGKKKAGVAFLSKAEREAQALARLQARREEEQKRAEEMKRAHDRFISGQAEAERRRLAEIEREREMRERERRAKEEQKDSKEHIAELDAIRQHYLGQRETRKRLVKPSEKFTRIFKFDWDEKEDTSKDFNPLYAERMQVNALFGRGYIAGIDPREQRKNSNFLQALAQRRLDEMRRQEQMDKSLTEDERRARELQRQQAAMLLARRQVEEEEEEGFGRHWSQKSLEEMDARDWRIFREDFDIRVKGWGGREVYPLRNWEESGLIPAPLLRAIKDVGYEHPSPIQRQAIPIGLLWRDLIGIAETGSGKTAAFSIPLVSYLLSLPEEHIRRVAEEGPLAVVMAPTRELAQQIEEEIIKFMRFTNFRTACIVGGQDIGQQGFRLREGVHVVIGTPGRIIECLELRYMVLNQCNYIVLDEADRMIDMGFEADLEGVMQAMGGLLKSEDERQAEEQAEAARQGRAIYRVTSMFSATMPPAVERIAKTYLRHPVVIAIGDEDSGKNKRIEQRIVFTTEGQKRNLLADILRRATPEDKLIVFVNAKKQADVIGRFLESAGFAVGVLHGGKTQDQREATMEDFRNNETNVLVATDVASRGLDIPDVTHVVNFDLPTKIETYTHRIGRTGRAGKSGIATSFLTDGDEAVMYDLKNYLASTESAIPQQLARHPAAQAPPGARREDGSLVNKRRD